MRLNYFKIVGYATIILLWINLVALPIIAEIDPFNSFAFEDEVGRYLLLEDGTKIYKQKSPFDFPFALSVGTLSSIVLTFFVWKMSDDLSPQTLLFSARYLITKPL